MTDIAPISSIVEALGQLRIIIKLAIENTNGRWFPGAKSRGDKILIKLIAPMVNLPYYISSKDKRLSTLFTAKELEPLPQGSKSADPLGIVFENFGICKQIREVSGYLSTGG